jgi:hypothetical protein
MAETDAELVDRMAKRHSVSPAAVQVVLTALRSGGGRMAQFSHADFDGMSQWSPGMSMVGDMFNVQLKAKLGALCSDIAAHFGRVRDCRWHAIYHRRGQLQFDVGIRRLVASRIRKAGCGGCSERSSIRGFRRRAPTGDRRPRRGLGVRHGRSSDFAVSPRPKAATERSRSRARMDLSKLRTLRRLPFDWRRTSRRAPDFIIFANCGRPRVAFCQEA